MTRDAVACTSPTYSSQYYVELLDSVTLSRHQSSLLVQSYSGSRVAAAHSRVDSARQRDQVGLNSQLELIHQTTCITMYSTVGQYCTQALGRTIVKAACVLSPLRSSPHGSPGRKIRKSLLAAKRHDGQTL